MPFERRPETQAEQLHRILVETMVGGTEKAQTASKLSLSERRYTQLIEDIWNSIFECAQVLSRIEKERLKNEYTLIARKLKD